mgnify:CR=1 FL=1
MMEKIYGEMYCSAIGSTEVQFYVESGTSDEFIMQKIHNILDLDITFKREQIDKLFIIRSTETNEYLGGYTYVAKMPKWTNQKCCAKFFETRADAMRYLESYINEQDIDKCRIEKVED